MSGNMVQVNPGSSANVMPRERCLAISNELL